MSHDFLGATLLRERQGGPVIPSIGEIGLNQFAPYLLSRLVAAWNESIAEDLTLYELTPAKMRTLTVLSVCSGLSVNDLSLLTVTEQSTMSRTLDSLSEQNYIKRRVGEEDGRIRVVHITPAGRSAIERFWPIMFDRFSQMFFGVEANEYQAFLSVLNKVLSNCNETRRLRELANSAS